MATNNFDEYINNVTKIITDNHEKIAQLHKDIGTLVQENSHLLKQLAEAIKEKQTMKTLQNPATS